MKHLKYEKEQDIGLLRINRPEVLNALNQETLNELFLFFRETAIKDGLKGLVLTGEGDKAFIAGADIKEMSGMNKSEILDFFQKGHEVIKAIETAPFITIAAVNGFALGGGLEIALGADFIYASKNAKFGFPEVNLGLIPSFGGTQRFPRTVGNRLAKEFILTGKTFNAEFAKSIGVVNHISEGKMLLQDSLCTLLEIIKNPASAFRNAKKSIDDGAQLPLSKALELELSLSVESFENQLAKEKMQEWR